MRGIVHDLRTRCRVIFGAPRVARVTTHVYMLRMSKKAVFSPAQNRALRTALAALSKTHSQAELGRQLDIAQQNVARLLRDKRAGFAYPTACRLVRLVGHQGVDAFFAARGVGTPESGTDVNEATARAS